MRTWPQASGTVNLHKVPLPAHDPAGEPALLDGERFTSERRDGKTKAPSPSHSSGTPLTCTSGTLTLTGIMQVFFKVTGSSSGLARTGRGSLFKVTKREPPKMRANPVGEPPELTHIDGGGLAREHRLSSLIVARDKCGSRPWLNSP